MNDLVVVDNGQITTLTLNNPPLNLVTVELTHQLDSALANIEANRRTLNTLIGDQGKANQIYKEASAFGNQFGYTQKEIASAPFRPSI